DDVSGLVLSARALLPRARGRWVSRRGAARAAAPGGRRAARPVRRALATASELPLLPRPSALTPHRARRTAGAAAGGAAQARRVGVGAQAWGRGFPPAPRPWGGDWVPPSSRFRA